jgi:glutathione S-transferase
MLTLFDYLDSGNGYKIRLLLTQLHTPFDYVEKDIMKGETRTPEFLARNPNGRIPVLELEDGRFIAESNAILWYLAEGTAFLPESRIAHAEVLQWMFFEQYSHEPYVATPRFIVRHLAPEHARQKDVPALLERGRAALTVMEGHLKTHAFFVGDKYSIADIALYAYTHVAEDGGHDLAPYPAVRAWLARVAALPDYVALDARPKR